MKIRTLAITSSLAVTLALSACSSDSDSASGSGSETVSVDTMFGEVEVPKKDDLRVVALGWSDAEMALSLDVQPVAVYDWQGFGEESKGVGPWAAEKFGDEKPTVIAAGGDDLNYEQIQQLDPDVILDVRAANDKETYDRLSEIAPTVFAPMDTPAFGTDWEVQLNVIGQALDKEDEAKEIADDVNKQIQAAAKPEFKDVTIASASKFGDAYGAYLPGDGRFDILADLGFVNNPPIQSLESNGFFATVPVEKVSAIDAQVAVILPIGFTLAEAQADPLLASLPVVQKGKAIFLDPESELAGAYGAASALSIPAVLEQLVPQLEKAVATG